MYKIGDKVVYIEELDIYFNRLTTYKTYEVINHTDSNSITINNDKRLLRKYEGKCFISVPEYRKLKLKKICAKLST